MPKLPNSIFFDIETSGKRAWESSVLSLAAGSSPEDIQATYAAPRQGSRMYRWAESKIWEPIRELGKRGTPIGQERELLSGFLKMLEGAPMGTRLAGWNIGTQPVAAGPGARGFDIPFLMRRAREYGMEDQYRKAIRKTQVWDVGAEYALKIASAVEAHGPKLVAEGVLHEDLYQQAVGFMKQARIFEYQQGVPRSQLAAELQRSGVRFAGWQLETVHKAMGFGAFAAHEAGADVRATMRLASAVDTKLGEEFVRQWAPLALENKLVASLKSAPWDPKLATPGRYQEIMKTAATMEARGGAYAGLSERVLASINDNIKAVGGSLADVQAGRGLREAARRVGTTGLSRTASRAGLSEGLQKALEIAGRHKGAIGVGVGVLGLMALQPGQWFSGADDEYNTIEGLPHGGMSEAQRRVLTDFGSGFTEGLAKVWKGVTAAPGQAKRTLEVASLLNKESTRAVSKITKEIVHGAKTGQPLELGVAGLTVAKGAYMLAEAGMGTLTPGGAALGIGSFIGTKWVYELIKKRNALKTAYQMAKAHPTEAKLGAKAVSSELATQVHRYIKSGERNIASSYIRAGGGEYGKQSVLAHLETMNSKSMVNTLESTIGRIAGKDDFYNVIEGLNHGGMAEIMRKALTPFGSGWDALRQLVKEAEGETFEGMLKSKGFQEALSSASFVKKLGKGAYGEVAHMKGTFRGTEFSFARKTAVAGQSLERQEIQVMKELQSQGYHHSPSVYGMTEADGAISRLDIEMFEGQSFTQAVSSGMSSAELSSGRDRAVGALRDLEKRGFLHSDTHTGNLMMVRAADGTQQIGVIDYGLTRRAADVSQEELKIAGHRDVLFFKKMLAKQRKGMAEDPAGKAAFKAMMKMEERAGFQPGAASGSLNFDDAFDDMFGMAPSKPKSVEEMVDDAFGEWDPTAVPKSPVTQQDPGSYVDPFSGVAFSGTGEAHNTVEGLQHGGLSEILRKKLTEFGSGWQGLFGKGKKMAARSIMKDRFSAKDDAYNTIEGLPHGGMAEQKRKELTEFGSGWIKRALREGVSSDKIVQAAGRLGHDVDKQWFMEAIKDSAGAARKLGGAGKGSEMGAFLRSYREDVGTTIGGEFWVKGQQLGRGGGGVVTEVFGKGGRVGALKEAGSDARAWQKAFEGSGQVVGIAARQQHTGLQKQAGKLMKEVQAESGIWNKIAGIFGKKKETATQAFNAIDTEMKGLAVNAKESMNAIVQQSKGMHYIRYEAEMTKAARKAYGDVVPDVLAVGDNKFVMEFAGSQSGALDKKKMKWLAKHGQEFLGSGAPVQHLDLHAGQVLRKGGRFQLADWGVAARSFDASPAGIKAHQNAVSKKIGRDYSALVKQERSVAEAGRVPDQLKSWDPANTPRTPPRSNIDKAAWYSKHQESQVRAAVNGNGPGKRHRRHTASRVVF